MNYRTQSFFLLGRPMLQARLENLQAVGPAFDLDYFQNRAMLNTLNVGPTLDLVFRPIVICVRRRNR
ncbi:lipopolysaccharide biosynthesis protein [Salmonella enterica subsp. arizonae]|uniref:Lipopolysaccharide biosynthesis protein n=1 Tax=Salmonella enterica subsp. arizonae TaxID=59203 RepID=A0A2X4TLW0_SALER|nr:lipopolysaccharide biosynthesis protein [Salmonella enterica subsp. arizonae]